MSSYNYEKALSLEWNGKVFVLTVRNETPAAENYLYSSDGINWTPKNDISNSTILTTKNPYNIKWLGSNFAMIGNLTTSVGNTLLRSFDGVSFSPFNTNTNIPLYDLDVNLEFPHTITFPKNVTLAVGGISSDTTKIAYSLDSGDSWTPSANSSTIFTNRVNNAAWNGRIWVAVGSGGNTIATSNDGNYWVGRGSYIFTTSASAIAWSNELVLWVAGGAGTNSLAYSHDGVYWTGIGTNVLSQVLDVQWNGSIWVAAGVPITGNKSLAYSYDGINWTLPTQTDLFDVSGIKIGWNGSFWTAIGRNSKNIATSVDGIVWTTFNQSQISGNVATNIFSNENTNISLITLDNTSILSTTSANYSSFDSVSLSSYLSTTTAVSYNGSYYLVGGNAVVVSQDGINWTNTAVSISGMSSINNFAWNNPNQGTPLIHPLTIACGEGDNTLAYSQDGIYWKGLGKTIFTTRANKAIWNGVMWVAVGAGNYWVATSYDGITWLGRENTLLTEGYDIDWNGTVFVVAGDGPNVNLAASRDGITWYGLPYSQVFSNYASEVAWTGQSWIAYGSGGNTTAYSTAADAWVWTATPQQNLAITDASSISALYIGNTLIKTSSSTMASYPAYQAFDNSMNVASSTEWRSASSSYNSTTGAYVGSTNTTYNTTQTASGEWIQIALDQSVNIKNYYLGWFYDTASSLTSIPETWLLLGSNDGTTWTSIDNFNYNLPSAPYNSSNNQYPFIIKLQNIWSNSASYQYYRFVFTAIFGGGSLSYVRVSEIDLFQPNSNSSSLNRFIKPIITPTHILHPTTIIPFSQSVGKQTVYLITDLCCNIIGNNTVNNSNYPTNIIYGATDKAITSSCFDGQTMVVTPMSGNICYMNTNSLNTNFIFDTSFNGILINSRITGNIYTSCYNGRCIIFGGNGGNVISYNTINPINSSATSSEWNASINANGLFTTVYGLASNSGYGFQYIPNRIYFNPGEKLSIIAPKSYNQNLSPNNTISMNLNNVSFIQNIVLPTINNN